MLRTYSRKGRTGQTGESVTDLYKSSQDSFFDSPSDPYFFDSQTSTTEDTQLQHNTHSGSGFCVGPASHGGTTQSPPQKAAHFQTTTPSVPDTSALSKVSNSSNLVEPPVQTTMPLPQLPAKRKSRLSQSSSQPLCDKVAALPKPTSSARQNHIHAQAVGSKNLSAAHTTVSRGSAASGEVPLSGVHLPKACSSFPTFC